MRNISIEKELDNSGVILTIRDEQAINISTILDFLSKALELKRTSISCFFDVNYRFVSLIATKEE